MKNPKNAGMQKMTDKVMRGGSPLAQQMEDDGIRWKNQSQLTNLTPNPNEIKVKRRKDGSIRKTIEGDRVKWDDEVGKQQIKTKYRRDGSKKKEVIKTVNSEDTGLFKDNERVGYSTTIRKYDKQNKPKTPKFQKTAGRGMWGELSTDKDSTTKQTRTKYRATAKQRLKEGATWAGITAGVVGAEIGAATLPFAIGEHRMKKGKKVFTETGWDKNY
jgi:hypothetical protein